MYLSVKGIPLRPLFSPSLRVQVKSCKRTRERDFHGEVYVTSWNVLVNPPLRDNLLQSCSRGHERVHLTLIRLQVSAEDSLDLLWNFYHERGGFESRGLMESLQHEDSSLAALSHCLTACLCVGTHTKQLVFIITSFHRNNNTV